MPRYVRIKDCLYGRYVVAGDSWDGCVYHQQHENRLNSVWGMLEIPGSNGLVEFRDMKHGYRLTNGEGFFVTRRDGSTHYYGLATDNHYADAANLWPNDQDTRGRWNTIPVPNRPGAVSLQDQYRHRYLIADGTNAGLRLGTSDGTDNARWQLEDATSSLLFSISRLQLPTDNIIRYFIDLTITPFMMMHVHLIAALEEALGKWIKAFNDVGVKLTASRVENQPAANLTFKWDAIPADSSDVGAFVPNGGGTGNWKERPGPLVITFNKQKEWSARGDPVAWQLDLRSVAAHELGHIFGIDHCNLPESFMQEKIDTGQKWTSEGAPVFGYDQLRLFARYMDVIYQYR